LAAAALAVVGMVSTSAFAQTTLPPLDPPQKIVLAYVPIIKFANAYVAADRGLFKKYGLDVEFERVKSGTEAIAFIQKGSVDVGGIAIVASLWSAWSRGMDIRVIAPGGLDPMQDGPTKVVARKDLFDSGAIKTLADLRHRRVAMAGGPGSGAEYLLAKTMEKAGLSIRDVEAINLGNADIAAALQGKSVDAALTASPYTEQILAAGTGEVIAKDMTPGLMTVAFIGSGKLIKERPEVAERFVLALGEAARLMQGENLFSQANIDAYMKFTNTTEQALRDTSKISFDPNLDIPVAGLADIERVHRENGRVDYDQPLDMSKVVDRSFTDKAVKLLGAK